MSGNVEEDPAFLNDRMRSSKRILTEKLTFAEDRKTRAKLIGTRAQRRYFLDKFD